MISHCLRPPERRRLLDLKQQWWWQRLAHLSQPLMLVNATESSMLNACVRLFTHLARHRLHGCASGVGKVAATTAEDQRSAGAGATVFRTPFLNLPTKWSDVGAVAC